MSSQTQRFRARARYEADRYGPDPWVFVRELLQNARDAGATSVRFEVEVQDHAVRVLCRDNGEGMTFDHAKRYLFALYASSKETSKTQVGRFGVGFWSILRFEPQQITVRSQPKHGEAWELTFDGTLEQALHARPSMDVGTEVILERASDDGHLHRRIYDAAWQNARFLFTRDDPQKPLLVTINGKAINAPFTLPAPSASFHRGNVRGVVGLGSTAQVELFSRGLRVRSAASLDDFLSTTGRHTSHSRVRFLELPGRMAPQALLESQGLELMLSRSDARENPSLRRLVDLAKRELERLIHRQIELTHPLPWWRNWASSLAISFRNSVVWRILLAAVMGGMFAFLIAWLIWGERIWNKQEQPFPLTIPVTTPTAENFYQDLTQFYQGPQVDVLDAKGRPVTLRYTPADQRLYFTALVIEYFEHDGEPRIVSPNSNQRSLYLSTPCRRSAQCVDVELSLHSNRGFFRIPVPVGHRLDVASTKLNGQSIAVYTSAYEEPLLYFPHEITATLQYKTSPALPPNPPPSQFFVHQLPPELEQLTTQLRKQPVNERIASLLHFVKTRVAYRTDDEIAALYNQARNDGLSFVERTLHIGAGDCDVQNGLLAILLQSAHVPTRLAIGYVGDQGQPNPRLHAWVEVREDGTSWTKVDASTAPQPYVDIDPTEEASQPPSHPLDPVTHPALVSQPALTPQMDTSETENTSTPSSENVNSYQQPSIASESFEQSGSLSFSPRAWFLLLTTFAVGFTCFIAVVLLRRRTKRSFALQQSEDLSQLLQSALQKPEIFQAMPILFKRPLVPLANSSAISLDRARSLASSAHLFRTRKKSRLARDAIAGGAFVLDESNAEARIVAETLGAIDLDDWEQILSDGTTHPLLEAVQQRFIKLARNVLIRLSSQRFSTLKHLDCRPLKLSDPRYRNKQIFLLSVHHPMWVRAFEHKKDRPYFAIFSLMDFILPYLDISPHRRAGLLAKSAEQAIREAGNETTVTGSEVDSGFSHAN